MFSSPQGSRRAPKLPICSQTAEIGDLYRRLSLSLDRVRGELNFSADLNRTVCLTVLEEDLSVLLEECEERLLDSDFHSERDMESLESRGDTVLEEAELLLNFAKEPASH